MLICKKSIRILEILSRKGISESFIYSRERYSHYFLTLGSVYISAGVISELGRRSHAWIACSETATEASPSWHLMLPKKVLRSISSNLNFWLVFFFGNPLRIGGLLRIPVKRIYVVIFCISVISNSPKGPVNNPSTSLPWNDSQLSLMTCAQRPNRLFFLSSFIAGQFQLNSKQMPASLSRGRNINHVTQSAQLRLLMISPNTVLSCYRCLSVCWFDRRCALICAFIVLPLLSA